METTLAHFAIVTYGVDPAALRAHIHPRFELDTFRMADGARRGLLSVVPFMDLDFRFVRFPWISWSFGQTNYRAYVRDTETGEHVAWFFGTALDSLSVSVPRYVWKLPWHRAAIRFDCDFDERSGRYRHFRMQTQSKWAPAQLELTDTGELPTDLVGFDDLETGLVLLTHPLTGYFTRRDGKLGSYSIWHDRLEMTAGNVVHARFPLLERLGLVEAGDVSSLHSVLVQPRTDFTIYLPPRRCD